MQIADLATRHPYRNKPVARAPVVSDRARGLAAHGVSIVLVCLVLRLWQPIFSSEVVFAAELLLVVGTWLFTLRCAPDNRVTRRLGWLLRVLATFDSGLVIADSLRFTALASLHVQLVLFVLPAVALLFVAARFHSFGLPKLTKKLLTVIAVCAGSVLLAIAGSLITVYLAVTLLVVAAASYLALWIWGFALMLRMRRMLRVDAQEWWLDVEALPQVEWTSYARLGDGRIELVSAAGGTCWFDNYADAIFWLDRAGFCQGTQALARGLVNHMPSRSLARSQSYSSEREHQRALHTP